MRRDNDRGDAVLPGEIKSAVVREFAWMVYSLEQGTAASGGRDYGGATGQEILLTYERTLMRLLHLDIGGGADLLAVTTEQAECCRQCISDHPALDEWERPTKQLCRK